MSIITDRDIVIRNIRYQDCPIYTADMVARRISRAVNESFPSNSEQDKRRRRGCQPKQVDGPRHAPERSFETCMVYVFLEDPDLNSIAVLLINQIHCDTKNWKAEICNNIPAHITKPEAHKRKIYNWSIHQTQQPRCPAACRLCDPRPRHVIVATTLAPVIPSPAHPTHQPKIPRIKYTYRLVAKTSRHRDQD